MSELIGGKEALIALANGDEVEFQNNFGVWHNAGIHTHSIGLFLNDCYKFRLKPRTITLNGIEVPAPFEPKLGEDYWHTEGGNLCGYAKKTMHGVCLYSQFGVWRTEEEIKQVVEALRSILK